PQCNKRQPGSGCGALNGFNRIHAILGQSEQCIATNPSDMNVALAALDAVVQVQGAKGTRSIAIADFHRLPGNTPNIDTNLQADELITAVDLPAIPFAILKENVERLLDKISAQAPNARRDTARDIFNCRLGVGSLAVNLSTANYVESGTFQQSGWDVVASSQILATQERPQYQ